MSAAALGAADGRVCKSLHLLPYIGLKCVANMNTDKTYTYISVFTLVSLNVHVLTYV